MRITNRKHGLVRPAFSFIELLVVFAIIAAMAAILLVAISQAINAATRTDARNDIAQMDAAIATAKQDLNNAPYLPSQIKLCKNKTDYNTANALDNASLAFLLRAFGNRLWANNGTIQWDGGQSGTPNGPWILYADQSLIFWLGGIPGAGGNLNGFSTNPADPSASGGTRKGPYFGFKTNRLVQNFGSATNGFYSYLDAWGWNVPYLYFSSNKSGNDYNSSDFPSGWPGANPANNNKPYTQSGTVLPYTNSSTMKYVNPNGFQILCAGLDGIFGSTGSWNPGGSGGSTGPAFDDQANFTAGQLGAGSN